MISDSSAASFATFDLVAIATSAGGLHALEAILTSLPRVSVNCGSWQWASVVTSQLPQKLG